MIKTYYVVAEHENGFAVVKLEHNDYSSKENQELMGVRDTFNQAYNFARALAKAVDGEVQISDSIKEPQVSEVSKVDVSEIPNSSPSHGFKSSLS